MKHQCHVCKISNRKKHLCLLSIVHSSANVGETSYERNPHPILFYKTKNQSCFDQMARMHSTLPFRRWPFAIRCNILDIAATNSKVLFEKSTSKILSGQNLILQLIEDLCIKKVSLGDVAANQSSIN